MQYVVLVRSRRILYSVKAAYHDTNIDTDTDMLARILADTSDTRDFLAKDVGMSVSVSMSISWNAALSGLFLPVEFRDSCVCLSVCLSMSVRW